MDSNFKYFFVYFIIIFKKNILYKSIKSIKKINTFIIIKPISDTLDFKNILIIIIILKIIKNIIIFKMSFKTKIVCSCNEKNIANLICIDAFCENREKNPIYCSEYCSKKHNHQSFMISPVIEYLFLKYSGQE